MNANRRERRSAKRLYENSFACVGRGGKERRRLETGEGDEKSEREITGPGFINTLEDKLAS